MDEEKLSKSKRNKLNKTGMRGIPKRDKHLDKILYVDGKSEGITRVQNETIKSLTKIAKDMKLSRSEVVRKALESFCKYQEEARVFGKDPFFTTKKTFDMWIFERNQIQELFKELEKMNQTMQENCQSSEVKMLSRQITMLATMINLTHKMIL